MVVSWPESMRILPSLARNSWDGSCCGCAPGAASLVAVTQFPHAGGRGAGGGVIASKLIIGAAALVNQYGPETPPTCDNAAPVAPLVYGPEELIFRMSASRGTACGGRRRSET